MILLNAVKDFQETFSVNYIYTHVNLKMAPLHNQESDKTTPEK